HVLLVLLQVGDLHVDDDVGTGRRTFALAGCGAGLLGGFRRFAHWKSFSRKGFDLVTVSRATRVSSNAFIRPSGTAFGPSDQASAGLGCVSMNRPATPAATPARASTGTMSRAPPLTAPRPPGFCTEWVTSNTTGAPELRISARLVMSATRLL